MQEKLLLSKIAALIATCHSRRERYSWDALSVHITDGDTIWRENVFTYRHWESPRNYHAIGFAHFLFASKMGSYGSIQVRMSRHASHPISHTMVNPAGRHFL